MRCLSYFLLSLLLFLAINVIAQPQTDSIPIQNISHEVVGYTTLQEGLRNRLYYSPANASFYSEDISIDIYESLKMPGVDITDFYGDVVLNPFAQPNLLNTNYSNPHEENFKYYGSGDVDGNGVVNFDDYEDMVDGVSNDQSDIDGDGNKNTSADRTLFYNYLTDQIPYLPAHWDFLTNSEKESWNENFFYIDSTNFANFGDCTHFKTQTQINSSGVEAISNSGLNTNFYDTTQNARFNIPIYRVSTETGSGDLHGINAIFAGSNTTNYNDWTFIEPQTDEVVTNGNYSLNEFADIGRYCYFYSNLINQYLYGSYPVIDFDLSSGTPSVSSQSEGLIETKPIEFTYIRPGGEKPSDTLMLYKEYMENSNPSPDSSGNVVGNADWSSVFHSDSTNRTGTNSDSTFFNYNIWRNFKTVSDYSDRIDSTLASRDSLHYPNRPAQIIQIRDTAKPVITRNQEDTVMYTSEFDDLGIERSSITDNCGYWDSVYVQTSTRNPNSDSCNHYNFEVKDSTYAEDPTGNNKTDVFTVNVQIDPTHFTYVPPNQQIQYANNLDLSPENTGGMAEATNPSGAGVQVTYDDDSSRDPDSTECEHYNFVVDRTWNATDTICYTATAEDNTLLTVFKPNSLVCDTFPASPVYIARGESKHPSNTGEPAYRDTVVDWFPTGYEYFDELIEATPTDTTWHRHFNGYEEICNMTTEDSVQIIIRDLTINQSGIEKESIYIYPNPTKENITIKSNARQGCSMKVRIYSPQGSLLVVHQQSTSEQLNIMLPEMDGLYLVRVIISGKQVISKRILKMAY
ncbi:MAG: T9SS type A sorting domain-containing protein [Bacteroidales bacterium]|nr:T9SS type A sorting domain-containing protein [Bacteroidales bacterium]MCF8350078.1 T9SS type A sorting domain-containing protein [Bacteroidales bacterium]MCF8374978.1 T9SS type A sorting domain-containing protein [Bacteroidales bacterium]